MKLFFRWRTTSLTTHVGLDSDTLLVLGQSVGANGVFTYAGRDDKGLGIVHHEGLKGVGGTLDDGFLAFQQVEHVDTVVGVVGNGFGEGVTARLNKLVAVKAGALFYPTVAFGYHLKLVAQVFIDILGVSPPVDDVFAALHVDGAGLTVETQALPVPQLKGKDVGRGADFEYHALRTGTMDGAAGYQEVIVLLGGNLVDILLGIEHKTALLGFAQVGNHGILVDALFQSQVISTCFASL